MEPIKPIKSPPGQCCGALKMPVSVERIRSSRYPKGPIDPLSTGT